MQVKNVQISVLLMSMFIFTLGFGAVIPVMAYFTKDMGATSLDVGILMSLFSAMELIFAPLWGKVSDRIGRKPIILMGLLGFGIFFTLTGLSTELWMVYVTQALAGVFAAGIFPASQAYVADITTVDDRRKVMGYMGAMFGLGMIIGPAISSVCTLWGLNVPFFVAAGLGLITFAFALVFLPESNRHRQAGKGAASKAPTNTSFTSIVRSPLGALMFLMLFISFAIACIDGTMAYYVMDKFGMSDLASSMPLLTGHVTLTGPNVTGIAFVCMGILTIVCQGLLVDRIACKIGEVPTILAGIVLIAAGMAMLLVVFDLSSLLLATCLTSIGSCFVNPCVNTMVSKRTASDCQGATMGVLGAFNSLGRVMGPTVGGLVYLFSVTVLYLGSAVIAVLCAAGFACWSRRQKEEPVKAAVCHEKSG